MVNQDEFQRAMTASIFEVLETMFFTPVDNFAPVDGAAAAQAIAEPIAVTLSFSGPFGGSFRLTMPETLACLISADFMGAAPADLSAAEVQGTVQEMVNMVTGTALSIYDCNLVFDLQIPQILEPRGQLSQMPPATVRHSFMIEALQHNLLFEADVYG